MTSVGAARERSLPGWRFYEQPADTKTRTRTFGKIKRGCIFQPRRNFDPEGKSLSRILKSEHKYPEWIIYLRESMPKKHFLLYAARYARRLPIAQRRLLKAPDGKVDFLTKDKRQKRWTTTLQSLPDFVAAVAEHVPDRYRHAIRYFGLLAPRTKNRTLAAVLALLGQTKRPRPRRLSWQASLQKYFGVDPLIDSQGQPMRWVGRLKPIILR